MGITAGNGKPCICGRGIPANSWDGEYWRCLYCFRDAVEAAHLARAREAAKHNFEPLAQDLIERSWRGGCDRTHLLRALNEAYDAGFESGLASSPQVGV